MIIFAIFGLGRFKAISLASLYLLQLISLDRLKTKVS
jgi:hypothetical protein